MKRTKTSKKRLNNLLMILMLAVVLMIMSTYAWFTSNRNASVESLDIEVAASNGLQISADAVNWKAVLRSDDLTAISTNNIPARVGAASTIASVNSNGGFDMYSGSLRADTDADSATYGEYLLTTTKENDADTENYAVFDIYLKVDQDEAGVKVSAGASESSYVGASNAARIGIIKAASAATNGTAAADMTTVGGTKYLWEPNADRHTATGINNAISLGYSFGTSLEEGTGNATVTTDAIKGVVTNLVENSANATTTPDSFATVTPNFSTTVENNNAQQDFGTLSKGITKVKVYLWVEGQDIDCENSSSGSDVTYDLGFALSDNT